MNNPLTVYVSRRSMSGAVIVMCSRRESRTRRRRVAACVRPNGAGKTTLLRVISGLLSGVGGGCLVWHLDRDLAVRLSARTRYASHEPALKGI